MAATTEQDVGKEKQDPPYRNGSVVDPTKNVLDLVRAMEKTLDQLRVADGDLLNEKIARLHDKAGHNATIIDLHAKHQIALDLKESSRLDSVRQVDQLAVKTESDRAAAAVMALAAQANTTAENLRKSVDSSAATLAAQLSQSMMTIGDRITSLERTSYLGAGKSAVSDPAIEKISQEVQALARSRDTTTGKSEGISMAWAVVIGAVGLIVTILGGIGAIIALRGP